jgi:hypothetical protein
LSTPGRQWRRPTREIVATQAALETGIARRFPTLTAAAQINETLATRAALSLEQLAQVRTQQARSDAAATATVQAEAAARQATVTAIGVEVSRSGTETVRQIQATLASGMTQSAATVGAVLTPRP